MIRYMIIFGLFLSTELTHAQLIDYDKIDTAKVYQSLEEALLNPLAVYRLNLTKKKLVQFPAEVLQLKNLNELILDKNKLDSIPTGIAALIYLQRISIYRNNLDNFKFITGLSNLVEIDLTANYIEAIPKEISNLNKLKILNLQLNTIGVFPTELSELESLEIFNLLDNDLNYEQQDIVRSLFPDIKVEMSEPCNCNFEEEGDD